MNEQNKDYIYVDFGGGHFESKLSKFLDGTLDKNQYTIYELTKEELDKKLLENKNKQGL